MSIGIGDLHKGRRSNRSLGSAPMPPRKDNSERFPPGAWAKSHIARPWDHEPLQKTPTAKRKINNADSSMNDDWEALYPHMVWDVDSNQTWGLTRVLNELSRLERLTKTELIWGLDKLRRFCSGSS
jgi:hypothetical protein